MIALHYYQRPFLMFHEELKSQPRHTHIDLRKSFWSLVPEGEYSDVAAQDLFWSYSKSLEKRAAKLIGKYSVAYWLHLSRRVGVGSGGRDKRAMTISINRFNVVALVQKYGKPDRCGHLRDSKSIDISKVLNGLLMSERFAYEKFIIEQGPPQLVLTDFSHINLMEYYKVEQIAYELWLCGAKLRSIGKGATIIVVNDQNQFFFETPDEVLDRLVTSYDSRSGNGITSETGVIISDKAVNKSDVFIPILNVNDVPISHMAPFFKDVLNVSTLDDAPSSFLLYPYPIKKYILAHLPFEDDFYSLYKVNFRHVVILISALCYRYLYLSIVDKQLNIIGIMMRGYEGPIQRKKIIDNAIKFVPLVCQDFEEKEPSRKELTSAFKFLELVCQDKVDIYDYSTLKMFCIAYGDYYYIDYSLIPIILQHLFDKINLNKHGFRGDLLEKAIGIPCHLPTTQCKAINGTKKQIDFSFLVDNILIIGECKAVARKPAFFNGSFRAIKLREERVVERGLSEVDEKAQWLIQNPIGTNYNIEHVKYILPVAISPFVEYIHSENQKYWVNDELPRVMELNEFISFVNTFDVEKVKFNLIKTSTPVS